jgi:hypothetical protein
MNGADLVHFVLVEVAEPVCVLRLQRHDLGPELVPDVVENHLVVVRREP